MAYRDAVIADSPVSYWRLGETSGTNAVDEQGVNAGTYRNTPALGAVGALSGDGDTAVNFAKPTVEDCLVKSGFILAGSAAFTVEAWVKTTTTTADEAIYCERAASGNDIFKMQVAGLNAAGKLQAVYRDDAGTLHFIESAIAVNNGAWHHCAWTLTGVTFQTYVDGVANGSPVTRTATLLFTNASPESKIAADTGDGGVFMNGSIDEVAVYTAALTTNQIAAHYAEGIRQIPRVDYSRFPKFLLRRVA